MSRPRMIFVLTARAKTGTIGPFALYRGAGVFRARIQFPSNERDRKREAPTQWCARANLAARLAAI
jgi:hypothetical protein